MSQFTVYNSQFTMNHQFTVYNSFAMRIQKLKTVNCKLKTATTEGVA